MLPLSPNAAKAVEKLFFAEQRQEVVRLLTEKCADNLPNCKDQDEYGLEDRRFQVLKLSGGNIDKLHDAIRMANEDWRDVMLAAGSATAYKRKLLGEGLERNAGSVSNFVFKAVLIRPGLLRQGEKNRLTAPSPG